jgi:Tfp pilus assembly PilM family ATPase
LHKSAFPHLDLLMNFENNGAKFKDLHQTIEQLHQLWVKVLNPFRERKTPKQEKTQNNWSKINPFDENPKP